MTKFKLGLYVIKQARKVVITLILCGLLCESQYTFYLVYYFYANKNIIKIII